MISRIATYLRLLTPICQLSYARHAVSPAEEKAMLKEEEIFHVLKSNSPQSWSQITHVWSRKKPKAIGPGIDPMILAMHTCIQKIFFVKSKK